MKKNLWVAVLLIAALALAAMTGCVNALKEEVDTETYEEYVLDKGFNAWAGQVYQSGWAIGGIVFQGKGDALTVAKDLGYDLEMFQKARYLEIEMPDETYPRSGVDIIWGGEDATGSASGGGGMWNQQPIAGGSGDVDTTFAKKDGNKLRIDLTKALKNYSVYKAATTTKVKIVMQVNAPSYGNVEGLVKKATLLIPNTPPPFRGVGDISLVKNYMYYTSLGFELDGKLIPSDATNQTINWAIVKWVPGTVPNGYDGSETEAIELPKLDPTDPTSVSAYEAKKTALLGKVAWQQQVYTIDDTVYPAHTGLKDVIGTLVAGNKTGSIGTVTVRALVKQGQQNKTTGEFSDYSQLLTFAIRNPPEFTFKTVKNNTETAQRTRDWGAVDNGGVKGGWMEVIKKDNGDTDYLAYTITLGGGYYNSHHFFKVTFPDSENLNNYSGLTCHYSGGDGDSDLVGKNIRVRAMLAPPTRDYSIGPFLSSLKVVAGEGVNGKEQDLNFTFYKDAGEVYNKIEGGVIPNMPDPQTFNGKLLAGDSDFAAVKTANTIYVWIIGHSASPSGGKLTTYTISDVKFIHK
jgi:hypothetical protein